MNCSVKIISRNLKLGRFYPEETDNVIFNVSVVSSCIEDTINDEFIKDLADEVEYIDWYTEFAHTLYGIAKMLGTICDFGGVFMKLYQLYAEMIRPSVLLIAYTMSLFPSPAANQAAASMACYTETFFCSLNNFKATSLIPGEKEKEGSGMTGWDKLCNAFTCNKCIIPFGGQSEEERNKKCKTAETPGCEAEGKAKPSTLGRTEEGWSWQTFQTEGYQSYFSGGFIFDDDLEGNELGFCDKYTQSSTDNNGQPTRIPSNDNTGIGSAALGGACSEMYDSFAIDPFDNIVDSLACGCVTGVLYNIRKLREIDCAYLACAYSFAVVGLNIEGCKEWREYNKCVYWWGVWWTLMPWQKLFEGAYNLLNKIATEWPYMIMNAVLNGMCPQYAKFQDSSCQSLGLGGSGKEAYSACKKGQPNIFTKLLDANPGGSMVCVLMDSWASYQAWDEVSKNDDFWEEFFSFEDMFATEESICEIEEVKEIIELIKEERE